MLRLTRERSPFVARAALALLTLCLSATPSQAEVRIVPLSPLQFGAVGADGRAVTSPRGAGRMELELVGSGDITLLFDLPRSLRDTRGAELRLEFGARDGRVTFPHADRVIDFDPNTPLSLRIPAESGGARVFIGGTVVASVGQAPGDYDAPITVHVVTTDAD